MKCPTFSDAASFCQATFAVDLQIFRLKTVRDFHFGILRNMLARSGMEKESNMTLLPFFLENGFAEKVLWILDVSLYVSYCAHTFVEIHGAAWGCSWHWQQSIHCSCHSMSMVSSAASCHRQNTGSNFHVTSMTQNRYCIYNYTNISCILLCNIMYVYIIRIESSDFIRK